MRPVRLAVATLLAACLLAGASRAAIIADYRADYQTGSFPTGWQYMWNAPSDWDGAESYNAVDGAIGTAANYLPLLPAGSMWTADGDGSAANGKPARYLRLTSTGGHPGRGSSQKEGINNDHDRAPIAAYTVQAGEAGFLKISNSSVSVGSPNSRGVEVRAYVNDTPVGQAVAPGGGSASFDTMLGPVSVGDTVYVALGPNGHDGSDSFSHTYQIETVADTTVMLWDADGVAPVDGGAGTWDTTNARCLNPAGGGTYMTWSNAGNYNAYFSGTGGTVALGVPVTARSLTFQTGGYTIAGGSTLTLTGAGSSGPGPYTVDVPGSPVTATIAAPVAGSGGLSKIGAGTLVLTGANSVSGSLYAAGGDLTLGGTSTTSVTGYVGVGNNTVSGGGAGNLNIQGSAFLTAPSMSMGDRSGQSGNVNQSGGLVTVAGGFRLGHYPSETSTYTLSNGTLALTGTPVGVVNPTGTPEQSGILYIGVDGTGVFHQTGGNASAHGIVLDARADTAGTDTLTLTGGTFTVGPSGIKSGSLDANTSYQINLGNATLKASASWSSTLNMSHTGTTWFDTNGNDISLSGVLSGGGSVTKIGAGRLSLTGGGSYGTLNLAAGDATLGGPAATTTLSGGVQVGSAHTAGGGSATLDIVDGSLTTAWIQLGNTPGTPITAIVNQSGGSVRTTSDPAESAGVRLGHYPAATAFYNLSGGTLLVDNGRYLTCAVDGTGTFYQTGGEATATRVVVNARTNGTGNGTFTVEGGTFNVGSGGIVNDAGPYAVNLGGAGGTIRASADFSSSLAMTLSGTGASAITFDSNGHTITLSGALTGTAFDKVGAGTLELTGTGTVVDNMVLKGGTTTLAGSSTTTVTNHVAVGDTGAAVLQIQDSATLNANNTFYLGESSGVKGDVAQTGGTVTIAGETRVAHWGSETSTYTLSDTGQLIANGDFNVGWDGTGIFTQKGGSSQFNAGLDIGAHSGAGATVNMNGGTMGVASLMLGDYNATAGAMNHSAGTVTIAGETRVGHWGSETSTYTLSGSGQLISNGTFNVGWDGTGNVVQDGGSAQFNGQMRVNRTGTVTQNDGASQFSNLKIGYRSGGDTATYNMNGGTLDATYIGIGDQGGNAGNLHQAGGTVTVSGQLRVGHYPGETSTYTLSDGSLALTGTPSGVVNPSGVGEQNGILYLGIDGTGVFTQTGGTASAHGIVLDARGDTAGTDTFTLDGGTFTVGPSGIKTGSLGANTSYQINLGGGTLSASADWASTLPMTLTGTGGNAEFDTAGHTITFSGQLSGTGGFSKTSGGTLILSHPGSTYTGTTTVAQGILDVTGSIAGSAVVVNPGATLMGTGTTGPISVGGTVAPGQSPGILHTGSVVFTDGSTFAVELNGLTVGTEYDQLHMADPTGTVTLAGVLDAALGHGPGYLDKFFIIRNDGTEPVSGTFDGLHDHASLYLPHSGGDQLFWISYFGDWDSQSITGGNDVVLVAVPEPATMILLGLGGLGLAARRRRK